MEGLSTAGTTVSATRSRIKRGVFLSACPDTLLLARGQYVRPRIQFNRLADYAWQICPAACSAARARTTLPRSLPSSPNAAGTHCRAEGFSRRQLTEDGNVEITGSGSKGAGGH